MRWTFAVVQKNYLETHQWATAWHSLARCFITVNEGTVVSLRVDLTRTLLPQKFTRALNVYYSAAVISPKQIILFRPVGVRLANVRSVVSANYFSLFRSETTDICDSLSNIYAYLPTSATASTDRWPLCITARHRLKELMQGCDTQNDFIFWAHGEKNKNDLTGNIFKCKHCERVSVCFEELSLPGRRSKRKRGRIKWCMTTACGVEARGKASKTGGEGGKFHLCLLWIRVARYHDTYPTQKLRETH